MSVQYTERTIKAAFRYFNNKILPYVDKRIPGGPADEKIQENEWRNAAKGTSYKTLTKVLWKTFDYAQNRFDDSSELTLKQIKTALAGSKYSILAGALNQVEEGKPLKTTAKSIVQFWTKNGGKDPAKLFNT